MITEEIIVLKDPNTHVSDKNLEELNYLQLEIIKKISQAKIIANKIETVQSKKNIKKNLLNKLKKELDKLVTKDGSYMQPMLIDQFNYLYDMISQADQILGNDAHERFDFLSNELMKIQKNIKSYLKT